MNSLNHFVIFDLTKIGTGYQIINAFVDDSVVRAFEVSPIGTQAVLILVSSDLIALQFVYQQCMSHYKSDILESAFVSSIDDSVIASYQSQNQPPVQSEMAVFELSSFSEGFRTAQLLADSGISLIDFRAVRTSPPNIILTATHNSIQKLNDFTEAYKIRKATLIEKVQINLKSYFEVVK